MPFSQHSFGTQHLDGAVDCLDFLNAAFFGNRAPGRIRNSGFPVAVHCNAAVHSEIARGEPHAENLIVHLKKSLRVAIFLSSSVVPPVFSDA